MRSLIILEVEHEDDTDGLQSLVESFKPSRFHTPYRVTVLDYTVRVDVPECFALTHRPTDPVWSIPPEPVSVEECLEALEPVGWDMQCGHFDAMNDPNHDCSKW